MDLYIIGNGFDLHHKMKTSLNNLKKFMYEENIDSIKRWQEITFFDIKEDWSNLEESFAFLDFDYVINECSCYLHSYSDDNWRESYHYDYQYEIGKYLDFVINSDKYLRLWFKNIDYPKNKLLNLDKDSLYLTFNYTNVLENVYEIPSNNICHIHGDLTKEERLILGHSNPILLSDFFPENIDDDVRVYEANSILNNGIMTSCKNSIQLIEDNTDFFDKLNNINRIYIIGHGSESIEKVDNIYYQKLLDYVNPNIVKVFVVYYDANDIPIYDSILKELGFINIEFLSYDMLKYM